MLTPRVLKLVKGRDLDLRSTLLQAALEKLVGLHLEGKIQAGLVVGEWGDEGVVLGYYKAYQDEDLKAYRRITGGTDAYVDKDTGYLGLVFASENLEEVGLLAEKLARCVGGKVWGATRFGPQRLASGVVEVIGDFHPEDAAACVGERIFGRRLLVEEIGLEGLNSISMAYSHEGWIKYLGAEPMSIKTVVRRGEYYVRVGIQIFESYISNARVDGVFHAAPPNAPFNLAAALAGQPANENALLLAEGRLGVMELLGVTREDFYQAFLRAIRSVLDNK
ncbi:MAG: hypothetical protein F7C35_06430 [Desulfurococcales archaeon]|nr:hypothetical protein [Desulfurococcales archaeon]